jgi:DNA-directed RNA polymerase specialized sigma54-like protein
LFGLFSFNILDILLNVKYSAIVAKNIMKELGNPLLKGVSNAIDEVKKEKKAEDEEKKEKEEKKENKQEEKKEDKQEDKPSTTVEYTKEELLEQIRKLEAERDSANQSN